MKIFVAKLPPDYDETDIATLFITYGDISTINLVTDRETGRSKGYAFVEMVNDEEALNAISHLDQKTVGHNKQLAVSQATERPKPAGGFNRNNNRGGGGGYNRGGGNYNNNRNTGYNKDRNSGGGGYNRGNSNYNGGEGNYNRGDSGGYNRDRGYNRHEGDSNKEDRNPSAE